MGDVKEALNLLEDHCLSPSPTCRLTKNQLKDCLSTVREWVEGAKVHMEAKGAWIKIAEDRRAEIARLRGEVKDMGLQLSCANDRVSIVQEKNIRLRFVLKEAREQRDALRVMVEELRADIRTAVGSCTSSIDTTLSGKGERATFTLSHKSGRQTLDKDVLDRLFAPTEWECDECGHRWFPEFSCQPPVTITCPGCGKSPGVLLVTGITGEGKEEDDG